MKSLDISKYKKCLDQSVIYEYARCDILQTRRGLGIKKKSKQTKNLVFIRCGGKEKVE